MSITFLVLSILMISGVITNIKIMGIVFFCLAILDFILDVAKVVCENIEKKKEEENGKSKKVF